MDGRREKSIAFFLNAFDIIMLATDLSLRELPAIRDSNDEILISLVIVDFEGLGETLEALRSVGLHIPPEDVNRGIVRFAQAWHDRWPEHQCQLNCGHSIDIGRVANVITASNMRKLSFIMNRVIEIENDHIVALHQALTNHPSLESINIHRNGQGEFVNSSMLEVISTIPNLARLHIDSSSLYSFYTESDLQYIWALSTDIDLHFIRQIVTKPTMKYLGINSIRFETKEVTESFCQVLSQSSIQTIIASVWLFPEGTEECVANGFTGESVLSLDLKSMNHARFMKLLGAALARPSTQVISLSLGRDQYCDADSWVQLLCQSRHWKLHEVVLNLTNWSDDLDQAISQFIGENRFLIKLRLCLYYHRGDVRSEALLKAVDSPLCSLQEFEFRLGGFEEAHQQWLGKVLHILALNSQRRQHDSSFKSIASAEGLVDALLAVDDTFIYDFLRRNEWGLQKLIVGYGGSHFARRRRSRQSYNS
jgi:hypothetical protein